VNDAFALCTRGSCAGETSGDRERDNHEQFLAHLSSLSVVSVDAYRHQPHQIAGEGRPASRLNAATKLVLTVPQTERMAAHAIQAAPWRTSTRRLFLGCRGRD
jgi:hypothetical protein